MDEYKTVANYFNQYCTTQGKIMELLLVFANGTKNKTRRRLIKNNFFKFDKSIRELKSAIEDEMFIEYPDEADIHLFYPGTPFPKEKNLNESSTR